MLIKNSKKDFNPTDKAYIDVADSNLYATQFARQMDWQFRIYAQLLYRSEQCDYNIYFFTLTFKDKFLPKFEYDGLDCPCFDHDIVNKFCRGVQMDLLRYFDCIDYDYVLCEEFGKSATFRPHLHGCFAVHNKVPALAVLRLIKKQWSVLTGEYHRNGCPRRESLGWVLPSKLKVPNHSDFQVKKENIDSCAIYLSKYCTKQIGWFINPKVKKVYKKLIKDGNKEAIQRFSKVKPRVKCSQHFGECIKDWIFNNNVPSQIKVKEDVNENLYNGVMTPLYRKGYTRIPFYIRRKLMWQKVEEYVEKYDTYDENEYYESDIFTNNVTRNLACIKADCPFTAFNLFKGLRPLKADRRMRYKWDVEISDFWRQYMPYEYEHRIKDEIDRIDNCKVWLPNSNFHKWLRDKLSKEQYDYFNSLVKTIDSQSLAVYKVCYKGRVSPLHLYAYLENPYLFKDSVKIEEINTLYFDRFAKKSYNVLVEQFRNTYYQYTTTYVDKDVILEAILAEIQPPFFSGHEDVKTMIDNSFEFYMSKANYCSRAYYSTVVPELYNVTFNCFPCFRGYDLVWTLLNDYLSECNEKKLKIIADKFEKKKLLKDNYNEFDMQK